MKNLLPLDDEYVALLRQIKSVIRSTQIKTALAVNQGLIELYWEIGKMIVREQKTKGWGSAVVERLAVDLKMEFPDMGGFSRPQLFFMRQFFLFYRDADEKVLQVVRQVPWGHNILIFRKSKNLEEALFYLMATFDNNWSRNILDLQLESNLYARQGSKFRKRWNGVWRSWRFSVVNNGPYLIFGFTKIHKIRLASILTFPKTSLC